MKQAYIFIISLCINIFVISCAIDNVYKEIDVIKTECIFIGD